MPDIRYTNAGGLSGLDLQRVCLERKIPIPIIFITGHGEIPMSVQAMKNGAADFLPKPYSPDDLLRAVRESIERDRTSSVHEHSVNRVQNRIDTLSAREKEVLGGVTAGMLNKQIAYKLGITEKTVKVHRANVMLKMKATSVPDLVRLAELANLASPSLD